MGTAEFAVPSLAALGQNGHQVVAVVTQPDKPQGRGRSLHASPVKRYALEKELELFQPRRVRSASFQDKMSALQPDLLVVAAFGQIVPQSLLDLPKVAPINVHGSLLPKYRGAAPIQHSIINGESETGVTTMWMDATLDTGDIILAESTPILAADDVSSLTVRMAEMGARLLLQTIHSFLEGTVERQPQEDAVSSQAPAIQPSDGYLDWSQSATQLNCRIRGVSPKPGAYTFIDGKRLKLWKTEPVLSELSTLAGVVLEIARGQGGVLVQAGNRSALRLIEVQPENGKRMCASDWARGSRLQIGATFDSNLQEG